MIIINSTTYLLKRIHLEHNLNVPLVAKLRGSEYTTGHFIKHIIMFISYYQWIHYCYCTDNSLILHSVVKKIIDTTSSTEGRQNGYGNKMLNNSTELLSVNTNEASCKKQSFIDHFVTWQSSD